MKNNVLNKLFNTYFAENQVYMFLSCTKEKYLIDFPFGEHNLITKEKILKLKIITTDWRNTLTKNTIKAYNSFIEKYPNSTFASIAKDKRDDLLISQWKVITNKNSISAYKTYIMP